MQNKGWLNTIEQFKHYVFLELAYYPNVKLYDFQASKEVKCNLDNYKDLLHYHQRINTWMLQQMRDESYLIKDNAQLEKSNRLLGKNIQECMEKFSV